MILFALMAVNDIHDKNIPLLGLPYIVKQALGNTIGNVFLIDSASRSSSAAWRSTRRASA